MPKNTKEMEKSLILHISDKISNQIMHILEQEGVD
jgi:hypothetical protein